MTLLPVTYLGSVGWFAHLLCDDCTIDAGEHFVKRSERNRARILTANGVMELSVHLQNANRPQTPVRELRIDYSKRWQHQHDGALRAAYKASPYFDYYYDRLEPFYRRRYDFLVDYDLELTALLLDCLGRSERMPRLSEHYVEAVAGDLDLRPKQKGPTLEIEPYIQVFNDRFPFISGLSLVDLLFAEGPSAAALLERRRS